MCKSEERIHTEPTARLVATDAWRLTVPSSLTQASPLLVIPTVHPRGDRRIVRCAQVALDAGFRIHLVWLGEGVASRDSIVSESLLPAPIDALARIRAVAPVARIARDLDGAAWHIHDFYFLEAAKAWRRRTGRLALYDVHEYYASYYSEKLPLPKFAKNLVARMLDYYQIESARTLGGANVVTDDMAIAYRRANVPVCVSPNYPLASQYRSVPSMPFVERRHRVLHIGTLSEEYGTRLLLSLVKRSAARQLPFKFEVIARFPSPNHSKAFEQLVASMGQLENLRMIPPRPTHEMSELLASAGFGLSLLTPGGQNEAAVPSKNYEHAMAGLVDVVTDRRSQRAFAEKFTVCVTGHDDDPDSILDKMVELASDPYATDIRLREMAAAAKRVLSWEGAVAPALGRMLQDLVNSRPPMRA